MQKEITSTKASSANPAAPANQRTALGGLLRRREMWTLSGRGWVTVILLFITVFLVVFFGVHPFLAITEPVPSSVLVVEGWIPDYALQKSWDVYEAGHYSLLCVTGVRSRNGPGMDLNDTFAGWGAERLQKMIGQHKEIVAVPAFKVQRDRTYAGGIALKEWFETNHMKVSAINVVTVGTHARRSRLLYEQALGPDVAVGVIALDDDDYDPAHWWKYSEGVKEVISEGASYIYARFIFHPAKPQEDK